MSAANESELYVPVDVDWDVADGECALEIPVLLEEPPFEPASVREVERATRADVPLWARRTSLEIPIFIEGESALSGEPPPSLSVLPSADDELSPGTLIAGRYEVIRKIGCGGMGVVYECSHAFLGRSVALKVVRRGTGKDARIVERLFREARLVAQVQSPNVVQVLDCGCLPDGTPYVVMELIQGRDLFDVLREDGPLTSERVIELGLQACAGLAQAHRHGIVHRDLKPENLVVSVTSENSECLKIIDFGISKQLAAPGEPRVTDPKNSVGSPQYMSPEQIAAPERVDARTDLWSLGVVMHELLTGSPPFSGAGPYEVCLSVLVSPAPNASSLKSSVPRALAAVLLRCLEKNPDKRFSSARELGQALLAVRAQLATPIDAEGCCSEAAVSSTPIAALAHVTPTAFASDSVPTQRVRPETDGLEHNLEATRSSLAIAHRSAGPRAAWQSLAPVLLFALTVVVTTLGVGLFAGAAQAAEEPCPPQVVPVDARPWELRFREPPRLAKPRGLAIRAGSLLGLSTAIGVDSRSGGMLVIVRIIGGAKDGSKTAVEVDPEAAPATAGNNAGLLGKLASAPCQR
jgi:serine/threonine-protein kinase